MNDERVCENKERLLERLARNAKNDRTRRFWQELTRVLYGDGPGDDEKEQEPQ